MKFKSRALKNDSGFTLIETLISGLLLAATAGVSVSLVNQIKNSSTKATDISQKGRVVDEIVESVQNNPMKYAFNYNSDPMDSTSGKQLEKFLPADKLPFGFNGNGVVDGKTCHENQGSCQGTFGVVIQPASNFRGLYVVHLRVNLFSAGVSDLQFVITDS